MDRFTFSERMECDQRSQFFGIQDSLLDARNVSILAKHGQLFGTDVNRPCPLGLAEEIPRVQSKHRQIEVAREPNACQFFSEVDYSSSAIDFHQEAARISSAVCGLL